MATVLQIDNNDPLTYIKNIKKLEDNEIMTEYQRFYIEYHRKDIIKLEKQISHSRHETNQNITQLKFEISDLRKDMITKISDLRKDTSKDIAELKFEISDLRKDMITKISDLRKDTSKDIAELKFEISDLRKDTSKDIAELKYSLLLWIFSISVAGFSTTMGATYFMLKFMLESALHIKI